MTKKEAVDGAVRLLSTVYHDDYNAVATIHNAHATYLETGETETLIEALGGVREFVDYLIKTIEE